MPCRYISEPHAELLTAAAEQMKITELRLRKLLGANLASGRPETPIAQADRRAGQIRAQLGALADLCWPILVLISNLFRMRPFCFSSGAVAAPSLLCVLPGKAIACEHESCGAPSVHAHVKVQHPDFM